MGSEIVLGVSDLSVLHLRRVGQSSHQARQATSESERRV